MITNRRRFVSLSAGILICGLNPSHCFSKHKKIESKIYLSAFADSSGVYYLGDLLDSGRERFRIKLPCRGHGVAQRPNSNEIASFARRPGRYITVVNVLDGNIIAQIKSLEGRHFYGHGVYSLDGRWLYATENEYDSTRGVIGIYDVKESYRLVETLPTYGIGPHEINLLSNGKILLVANGGILTHPDSGRNKLNLSEMDSSLAYIDIDSGKLLSAHRLSPELKLMSIRHFDLSHDENVAIVMKYQRPRSRPHPLVGFQKGSSKIELLSAPKNVGYRMKNYCGSVAFDSTGNLIAVSSPRGGIISFWSVPEKRFLSFINVKDGCGVASGETPESFLITNGFGQILRHSPLTFQTDILSVSQNILWDNHIMKGEV